MSTKKIDKFYYFLSGSEASLGNGTSYNCVVDSCNDVSGIITIPESVKYGDTIYAVTKIAALAFYKCRLTGINLPKTIKTIGRSAFDVNLIAQPLDLPESLIRVDDLAFAKNAYTTLRIPKNLKSIGVGASHYNAKLTSISVDPQNTFFRCDSQSILYDYDFKTLILSPMLDSVIIPSTVTQIRRIAFYCCSFTKIVFPPNVKSFEYDVIDTCSKLQTIIIQGNAIFTDGYYASLPYESFIYYGTKEIKNTIFNENVPNFIIACTGYQGKLLGQKEFIINTDCHSYPNGKTCIIYNNQRVSTSNIILLIIIIM